MHYVYLLQSISHLQQKYVGSTHDLKKRLEEHNAGSSPHTSKFVPWKLKLYVAFENSSKAQEFETYLKHGSGHAFAKKHFWE